MSELIEITEMLLEGILEKLPSKSVFNLWFGEFELISLDEKAVFKTPTPLKKNVLSTKYKDIISEELEKVIGFKVEIEITSPPEAKPMVMEVNEPEPIGEPDPVEETIKKETINNILSDSAMPSSKKDEYTFDNFIEGDSNKFVKAACLAVSKDLNYYNPLFIHGHSGLGKTHLLYATIKELKKNHSDIKIVYKTCEDFMNEMTDAISRADMATFKNKYRTVDVLLIDDIQFLAGKFNLQEEFFHTFSTLYERDKQIILTSDRPPKDIQPLEDRLRSRFEGGVMVEVLPPSYELRIAIIKKKCSLMNLVISNELCDYMAERLQKNIRQIEGVIKKIFALNSLSPTPITKEIIDNAISYIDPGNIPTGIMVEKILSVVSNHYGVSIEDIKSKKKTQNVSGARQTAIYIIRNLTSLSQDEIGKIVGRDHATVIYALSKIETSIKTKNKTGAEIKKLIKEIKG